MESLAKCDDDRVPVTSDITELDVVSKNIRNLNKKMKKLSSLEYTKELKDMSDLKSILDLKGKTLDKALATQIVKDMKASKKYHDVLETLDKVKEDLPKVNSLVTELPPLATQISQKFSNIDDYHRGITKYPAYLEFYNCIKKVDSSVVKNVVVALKNARINSTSVDEAKGVIGEIVKSKNLMEEAIDEAGKIKMDLMEKLGMEVRGLTAILKVFEAKDKLAPLMNDTLKDIPIDTLNPDQQKGLQEILKLPDVFKSINDFLKALDSRIKRNADSKPIRFVLEEASKVKGIEIDTGTLREALNHLVPGQAFDNLETLDLNFARFHIGDVVPSLTALDQFFEKYATEMSQPKFAPKILPPIVNTTPGEAETTTEATSIWWYLLYLFLTVVFVVIVASVIVAAVYFCCCCRNKIEEDDDSESGLSSGGEENESAKPKTPKVDDPKILNNEKKEEKKSKTVESKVEKSKKTEESKEKKKPETPKKKPEKKSEEKKKPTPIKPVKEGGKKKSKTKSMEASTKNQNTLSEKGAEKKTKKQIYPTLGKYGYEIPNEQKEEQRKRFSVKNDNLFGIFESMTEGIRLSLAGSEYADDFITKEFIKPWNQRENENRRDLVSKMNTNYDQRRETDLFCEYETMVELTGFDDPYVNISIVRFKEILPNRKEKLWLPAQNPLDGRDYEEYGKNPRHYKKNTIDKHLAVIFQQKVGLVIQLKPFESKDGKRICARFYSEYENGTMPFVKFQTKTIKKTEGVKEFTNSQKFTKYTVELKDQQTKETHVFDVLLHDWLNPEETADPTDGKELIKYADGYNSNIMVQCLNGVRATGTLLAVKQAYVTLATHQYITSLGDVVRVVRSYRRIAVQGVANVLYLSLCIMLKIMEMRGIGYRQCFHVIQFSLNRFMEGEYDLPKKAIKGKRVYQAYYKEEIKMDEYCNDAREKFEEMAKANQGKQGDVSDIDDDFPDLDKSERKEVPKEVPKEQAKNEEAENPPPPPPPREEGDGKEGGPEGEK
uniref:Tyrosine-protein phosphatase domain-containing protein n=1 Tax=Caenorhabditis tropicalis TaxID=1561998 RepID=A0A1I7UP92_9PELO